LVPPHVHLDVILDGVAVDPFAIDDEVSLWRRPNDPVPSDFDNSAQSLHEADPEPEFEPTAFTAEAVDAGIATCRDPAMRTELEQLSPLWRKAGAYLALGEFYPSLFADAPSVYPEPCRRTALLDLPFRAEDFRGVVYPDEG